MGTDPLNVELDDKAKAALRRRILYFLANLMIAMADYEGARGSYRRLYSAALKRAERNLAHALIGGKSSSKGD